MTDVRPIYETPENRAAEAEIAAVIERTWSCDLHKLPMHYKLDYMASKHDQLVAWLEVKRRHCNRDTYETIYLSLIKVMAAHSLHSITGKRCFFIVQFNDCLAYADILGERTVSFGGRTDRGDWQDEEPLVLIPKSDFTIIKPRGE
jgi:hypothetical protein